MLKILHQGSRYISFEIKSDKPYKADGAYAIYLNGALVSEDARHVQTLYNLKPDTEYSLEVKGEVNAEATFRTKAESFTLNVRDFGALGDGVNDDTQAIQAALYVCPEGGRVLVPAGVYFFSSLYFKSNTKLELAKGATLKAQEKRVERAILPGVIRDKDNEKYYLGSWEGNPLDSFASLFNLIDVHNVEIYGEGVLDGNASKAGFWNNVKVRNVAWRPRSIFMKHAEDVKVVGITIKNSPAWTVHPMFSKNLKFINTSIQNPWDSPNTDGINPESSKHVDILGCHFSLGDDCIAIKAGKIYMANELGIPSEHINVRNCFMEHGHGGVTIGSEMAAGVHHVLVEQCIFQDTDRGLRIKTRRGRGHLAVVDAIHFKKIKMDRVMAPFVLNMFYFCDPDGHSEYVQCKEDRGQNPEDLPALKHFVFEDIVVTNSNSNGFFAYGLPEQPIESLELKNISIELLTLEDRIDGVPAMMDGDEWQKEHVFFLKNIKQLKVDNVSVLGDKSDHIFADNIEKGDVHGIRLETK